MNNETKAVATIVHQVTSSKSKDGKTTTETTVAVTLDPRLVEAFLMNLAASNGRDEKHVAMAERDLVIREAEEKRRAEKHIKDMAAK
jgi:hypothetical protein